MGSIGFLFGFVRLDRSGDKTQLKKGGDLILKDGKEFLELGHDQIINSLFQVFRARAEGTYNLYKETRQKR